MTNATLLSIVLDKNLKQPLFQQLYTSLSQAIAKGAISPGIRLPSSREFAGELQVSRSTVITAYDQLVAEGYVSPVRGSGLYVLDIGEAGKAITSKSVPQSRDANPVKTPAPFQHGIPDMRLFPYKSWGRHVSRAVRDSPQAFVSTAGSFGDMRLRKAIAGHLEQWRGFTASPSQIIITAGASDALELCLRMFQDVGKTVALEDPGYYPFHNVIASLGFQPMWLPVDDSGAVPPLIDKLAPPPVLTVLTPSHQFPLGGTMPTARRNEFLRLAAQSESWILEDDFDSEYRYSGRPIPALATLDHLKRVIYVGSFSKIFTSGLRIGYMVVPEQLIEKMASNLDAFGSRASAAPQRPLATFIEDGEFHRHLRRMRRTYSARRLRFIELLQSHLDDVVSFADHGAGMQIAVAFPDLHDDRSLAAAAQAQGIYCVALSTYFVRHPPKQGWQAGHRWWAVLPITSRRPLPQIGRAHV